jgi:hypothetical protein
MPIRPGKRAGGTQVLTRTLSRVGPKAVLGREVNSRVVLGLVAVKLSARACQPMAVRVLPDVFDDLQPQEVI